MAEQTDLSTSTRRIGQLVARGDPIGDAPVLVTPLLPDVAVLHPVHSWLPHRVDEVFVLGRLEPIVDPPATRCVDDNSIARG